ncbi:diacylglycerol kinase [Palleronia sp. KMU-117]|uniref:diacylglycerol kinase n=1 Tax=Palleronia sp. KMU-117 TaxID=3434108 RepID=UPI003D707931
MTEHPKGTPPEELRTAASDMGETRYFFHRLKLRTLWSWDGLAETWRTEYSFRTWVVANALSAALAFALPLSTGERALILALGLLVLVVELLNTAVERAVDYISTASHPLAKASKDAASGAVAVAAVAAGLAWAVILWGLYG